MGMIGSRMTGFRPRPQTLGAGTVTQTEAFLPGSTWTGTAASGFSTLPSDPPRSTAKPTVRLVTPPNQRFTHSHVVGVMAFANDGGTLIGGIDRVRFHFEGSTLDIVEPTLRSFSRMDGSSYKVFGYWATLGNPIDTNGDAHLYIEAIPADATMQSRVMGPYLYSLEDTLHDYQIEVAASASEIEGERYRTLEAAISYLKNESARNPIITVTETGIYLPTETGPAHVFKNWLTITASPGVTCTLGRASFLGDGASRFTYSSDHICFRGVTFDLRYVASIQSSNNTPFWADRCTITNSDPDGSFAKWRGQQRPHGFIFEGSSYLTDNHIEFIPNALGSDTALARGNFVTDGAADVAGDVQCMTGNVVRNWNSSKWLLGEDIFTVTYTGTEPTARLISPASSGNTRTLTASWGGNSDSITLGRLEADFDGTTGNAYWPRQVVDWINGTGDYAGVGLADQDAGWNATLLDDTIGAFFINIDRNDPEFSGGANGAASTMDIDVKGQVRSVKGNFDIHADGYQQRWQGTNDNVIIAGEDWEVAGQLLFLSAADAPELDYTVVNNRFKFLAVEAEYITPESNLGKEPKNNVVVAHNSWFNQRLRIRYDNGATLDDYCLIANNVVEDITDVGASSVGTGIIFNNHLYLGGIAPANSANTSIGGDATSLFVDAANGDFSPTGALLANGHAPVLSHDAAGIERKPIDAVGAIGSGAAEVTEYAPPPPQTQWDFSSFTAQTIGSGAQAKILSPTLARATRIDGSNAGGLVLALPAGTYRLRADLTAFAGNGAAHLRLSSGSLSAPSNIAVQSGSGLYFADGPVDATFTFASADNLVIRPGTNGRSLALTTGANALVEKIA